ncbi:MULTISPECIES: TRAP transporter large permease subunit [unclassified Roseitalea]|uniref:TRAP transporter large permease n=1 Tax=unclassified Roseitalea TaxID=2639107 RepID=UPI00273E83E5|nr:MULTISPECIES: TRAP transporter large permease subunit [unclassified Roseitalea]
MSIEVLLVVAMFASFLVGLFAGFPVAFVLGGVGVAFALLGEVLPAMGVDVMAGANFIGFATDRIFGIVSNYSLVPMSLFVFMGFMLDRSGIAERLLAAMARVLARTPGGLGLSVVGIGVVLAASTGIIGAAVVLLATVALPAFRKAGYDIPLSLGTVAASGCLGILIPPSIMLIVMGDQLRLSVGDLFMGAVFPGLVLAALYASYLIGLAIVRPAAAPSMKDAGPLDWDAVVEIVKALVPPLLLMALVLGSIFMGIASPTEASGLGALGAIAITFANGALNWTTVRETCFATAKTTAFLYAIMFGATCFSVVLRGYGGDAMVEEAITGINLPPEGILLIVMLVVFVLGFVLDWMEIVLIVAPLTVPVVVALGFDPLWVAMLLAVCLQTSFLTPPVGMALFYVKSVAPPDVNTAQIYRGIVPFVILQLIGLALVWNFPQLVKWLPSVAY